jgi:Zn-dependent protease with chaperone function
VVVTTGALALLSDDELDAVVCHELGHIKHRDVTVQTVLALVPAFLYLVARVLLSTSSDDDDDDGGLAIFALAFFVLYALSELAMLAFSRAREYAADRWACELSGDGEALAGALLRIEAASASRAVTEREAAQERRQSAREARRDRALDSLAALALHGRTGGTKLAGPQTVDIVVERCRAELARPRRIREWFSSHPTIARRLLALEQSGLPGAPRRWNLSASLRHPS